MQGNQVTLPYKFFLDLKGAFDTVPHDIMPKKLFVYEIRGTAFKLLKIYLTGRTQYVIYEASNELRYLLTVGYRKIPY